MGDVSENNHRHIPPELLEEILHKLPQKSVIRFLSVSKSWNSMILGSSFVKAYRGRKLMVLKFRDRRHRDAFECSDNQLRVATPIASPFNDHSPLVHATCDELWCVEVEGSMFLWNPSMQTYRNLPKPSLSPRQPRYRHEISYGLGYDSAADDYKMVRVLKSGESEMYSARSNSWREIQHRAVNGGVDWIFSRMIIPLIFNCKSPEAYERNAFREYRLKMGVFVAGALHWTAVSHPFDRSPLVKLISFHLSTEKYGELGLPEMLDIEYQILHVEMTALKGMLCLCVNSWIKQRFVLWSMEDYGAVESWTKMLDIDLKSYLWLGQYPALRPFYFDDDNGEILTHVCGAYVYIMKFMGDHVEEEDDDSKILVCKIDKNTLVEKDFRRPVYDSFVYVQTLVLPEHEA